MKMFENRKLIIATMHQKESVIAPILEKELGVICFTDKTFNTDKFGTFSGEINRELDPISVARQKCLNAMKINSCDLGIASEGSFGPHPTMFFANADDEFLLFIDSKNKIEIIARELSTSTNYNAKKINNYQELLVFAEQVGFPEHGLILRKSKNEINSIFKGLVCQRTLKNSFDELKKKYDSVFVETDMRAMYNPTRMKVIEKATISLVQKIKSKCPSCLMPGFGITDSKSGLKCDNCGSPTNSPLSYIYVCKHCKYMKEELYPHKKISEDPMYCNYCNP
jgi:hypothetical protein